MLLEELFQWQTSTMMGEYCWNRKCNLHHESVLLLFLCQTYRLARPFFLPWHGIVIVIVIVNLWWREYISICVALFHLLIYTIWTWFLSDIHQIWSNIHYSDTTYCSSLVFNTGNFSSEPSNYSGTSLPRYICAWSYLTSHSWVLFAL